MVLGGAHGRSEGGQGVTETATGRLQADRRAQLVQVPNRRDPQPLRAPADAAQPAPHGARRHAELLRDPAVTAPTPAARPTPGGHDLDPVPAAWDTPAGQQHVGVPARGAARPSRGQTDPAAVQQRHHPGAGRDLPDVARGEDGRMAWRMRARHRLREPETPVDRASDEEIVALLRACRSARDRLLVLVMARAGLRRGELCGLRRGDVHLLADSRALGCEVARAHLHVVRREDNPNRAWAKSRRQRVVPLDFLVVQAFDTYEFERMRVAAAADSDFVFVNLFRAPIGAPLRPDAVGELLAAASRRAGLDPAIRPHQLRHAFASNVADAGGGIDVVADLLGHASVSSSQVYSHPDPSRLRAAVDAVPSPREQAGAAR